MVVAPGEGVPQVAVAFPDTVVNDGVTVTAFAAAPPAPAVFCTLAVSATAWPATSVDAGGDAKLTASPAAAWIVVAGLVVAAPVTAVPEPADVPFAVAVNVIVPEPDTVQLYVYAWDPPAAMVVAPGATVPQVAAAEPVTVVTVGVTVTALAAAPPAAFCTFAVSVTTCPAT